MSQDANERSCILRGPCVFEKLAGQVGRGHQSPSVDSGLDNSPAIIDAEHAATGNGGCDGAIESPLHRIKVDQKHRRITIWGSLEFESPDGQPSLAQGLLDQGVAVEIDLVLGLDVIKRL